MTYCIVIRKPLSPVTDGNSDPESKHYLKLVESCLREGERIVEARGAKDITKKSTEVINLAHRNSESEPRTREPSW